MLAEERLSRIMKLLSQQRTATVQELCEALDASESTIRRDLNELDRMGKVNKVHGGATLPDSQFLADEPTMAAKEASIVSAASQSFSTSRSSRPRMASMSRRPALKTALFFPLNQRGSSKPQILPAQPPASQMTTIPFNP